MGETSIEWTDFSINPIRARIGANQGHYCEKVSPGCKNCYSSRLQPRFRMPQFQEQRNADVEHFLDAGKLEQVLKRRKPTKFFWCDMSDMFGDWVPFEWVAACFGVMAATPQHTHQVLTKRADRMREWFQWIEGLDCDPWTEAHAAALYIDCESGVIHKRSEAAPGRPWPLPNVHLGVSAENQKRADERIPQLLQCPAAVRFVSLEPMLGPIDITRIEFSRFYGTGLMNALTGEMRGHVATGLDGRRHSSLLGRCESLRWVIAGSESGPGARPMNIEWAESLRDQCTRAGIPFFTKQISNAKDRKGGNPEHWPPGPWPREFPEVTR